MSMNAATTPSPYFFSVRTRDLRCLSFGASTASFLENQRLGSGLYRKVRSAPSLVAFIWA